MAQIEFMTTHLKGMNNNALIAEEQKDKNNRLVKALEALSKELNNNAIGVQGGDTKDAIVLLSTLCQYVKNNEKT